jgi:hypothetical protein
MPIIQGFPPSNMISPSVRITEQDLSYYASDPTFHSAGIIGFASKGPINKPTLIVSKNELNRTFGYPHPDVSDPYLIYAAEQYLLVANQLYIIRCADTDNVSDECAATAYSKLAAAGQIIDIIGGIPKATPSDCISDNAVKVGYYYEYLFERYVFPNGAAFFRYALNGQLAQTTLVVTIPTAGSEINVLMPDGSIRTVVGNLTGVTYLADELAAELNAQINPSIDGIEFLANILTGTLEIRTTWAYGPNASFEFISVQDAAYGTMYRTGETKEQCFVDVIQMATGSQNNQLDGQSCISGIDRYGSGSSVASGTWDFSGLTGLNLQIVIDGTDNQLIDNKVQIYDISECAALAAIPGYPTTAEIITYIQRIIDESFGTLGGFYPVDDAGYLRFDTRHIGRDARILVKAASTANLYFEFDALTKSGAIQITGATSVLGLVVGDPASSGDYAFTLTADSAGIEGNYTSVFIQNDVSENIFTMMVYSNGTQVEAWGGLTMDVTSSRFVGTYLSLVSDYVQALVETVGMFGSQPPPADGWYYLGKAFGTEGSDGIPALPEDQDVLLMGNAIGYTGLYGLSDPEQIDIDIIAIPGHSSTDVISELITFCQQYRQDCMAIIDCPFGLTVTEIIAWQNGSHPLNFTRFDSDFLALYWPWVKIRDTYNHIDVWVPPSGSIMAVYARNDLLAAPWFAPAGETRGIVTGITDVFNRPTLAERDSMYGSFNCINPIVQFSNLTNFLVWGQKTMQRLPTALDRVNVRRLMFVIEKKIRIASRHMLFDPHDETFNTKFTNMCSRILDEIKVGRGLYEYIIKADSQINTPDVIDRNEFRANIGIQPTKAVEFMFLTFSIHRTGDWSENSMYL